MVQLPSHTSIFRTDNRSRALDGQLGHLKFTSEDSSLWYFEHLPVARTLVPQMTKGWTVCIGSTILVTSTSPTDWRDAAHPGRQGQLVFEVLSMGNLSLGKRRRPGESISRRVFPANTIVLVYTRNLSIMNPCGRHRNTRMHVEPSEQHHSVATR